MIRYICIALFCSLSLVSCQFPNREACLALQDGWSKLRPATEYGIMSRQDLDTDSKKTRMRLVVEFSELIDSMVNTSE